MTSTPSLRLVYFQVRARVESARMILAYGNIAYKDDDCNSYFGMSFPEAKKAGKLPFGQLPILEVGGEDGKLIGIFSNNNFKYYFLSFSNYLFYLCIKLLYNSNSCIVQV